MGISSSQNSNTQGPKQTKDFTNYSSNSKKKNNSTTVPLVICYSYIGTGYHGLQQNLDQKTIEKDLLSILINCELIYPEQIKALNKIRWKEASRTDVGVHSAAQILTFDAHFPSGLKLKEVLPLLKSNTPEDVPIYFWSVISVGRQFNAYSYAEYRQYYYLMPLYALGDCDLNYLRKQILPLFVGQLNFHNYTKHKSANTESAIRTITDLHLSDPFIIPPNNKNEGEKYVLWYIRGKSFLINQIRKMLAIVLSAAYNLLTIEQLKDTFTETKWALPRLPGDGLLLNKVEYPNFLQKSKERSDYNKDNKDVEFNSIRHSIEEWKQKVLFPHIAKIVEENDTFRTWINNTLLKYPPEKLPNKCI